MRRLHLLAPPCLALAVLLLVFDTCPHTVYEAAVTVAVFEDDDGDGVWDEGEHPIRGTVVVAKHNIHGGFTRSAVLTDAEGQATLAAEYTHVFEISVLPPCGFRATTETTTSISHSPRARFEVGFVPERPRSGTALLSFYLWEDLDGDGLRQADELAIPGLTLHADPQMGRDTPGAIYRPDAWSVTTDQEGRATLGLGNSCGTVCLSVPFGWRSTAIRPSAQEERDALLVPYSTGITEIEWGLRRLPSPTSVPASEEDEAP